MKKLFALSLISILCMPLYAQEVDYEYNTVENNISSYNIYLSIDGVLYLAKQKGDYNNYYYAPTI